MTEQTANFVPAAEDDENAQGSMQMLGRVVLIGCSFWFGFGLGGLIL